MDVQIVKAELMNLEDLRTLGRKTFSDSFASGNTKENMQQYLDAEFSSEKLLREISDLDSEFYLARLENKLIGYLKVNFAGAQTELKENKGMEIERIYVLKEFQGKAVGQLLFLKALEMAKQKDVDYLWLGVWEKNTGAIRFYKKNGFVPFNTHIFKVGADEQTDIMMKKNLK